jgi:phosphoglycerol transferase
LALLARVTDSAPLAANIYYLLGFPLCFLSAFYGAGAFGISLISRILVAVLFAFLPFHDLRMEHLFLTWYFPAPIFFAHAYSYFVATNESEPRRWDFAVLKRPLLEVLAFGALATFGVYYAFFGVLLFSTVALARAFFFAGIQPILLQRVAPAILGLVLGVSVSLIPNQLYFRANGKNPGVGSRSVHESEVYGFKPAQLLLPRPEHRIRWFRDIARRYSSNMPLVNENQSATLGALGAVGLLGLFIVGVSGLRRGLRDPRLLFLVVVTGSLFLWGVSGGFGVFFSLIFTPLIRCWNRISVFIAFGGLLAIAIAFDWTAANVRFLLARKWTVVCLGTVLLVFGLFEQTSQQPNTNRIEGAKQFALDREFVSQVENQLPLGSALVQLPYMQFPEVPTLHQLAAYDQAAGFIHSKKLKWSFGAIKGREGDRVLRSLGDRSMVDGAAYAKALGFAAIYFDYRGVPGEVSEARRSVDLVLGTPIAVRRDGLAAVYRL